MTKWKKRGMKREGGREKKKGNRDKWDRRDKGKRSRKGNIRLRKKGLKEDSRLRRRRRVKI